MGTKFKVDDIVYVKILHSSGKYILYEGLATVIGPPQTGNTIDISYYKCGMSYKKYVYTNGTDGDIIRHATKLDKYLLGVE